MSTDHDARIHFGRRVRRSFTPGPGWRHLAGPVWERDGVRVHMGGLVYLPNGDWLSERSLGNDFQQVGLLIRINGGNRKRGLLAWGRLLGEFTTA